MKSTWQMTIRDNAQFGSIGWLGYTIALLALVLVLLPGLVYLGIRVANPTLTKSKLKREFINQSYALVPIGLFAWIAFSLSFVFANFSYVIAVISDPFGWGWNLFGTAGMIWAPYLSAPTPLLQILALLAGLVFTILSSQKIAKETNHPKSSLPLIGMSTILVVGQLWILVG